MPLSIEGMLCCIACTRCSKPELAGSVYSYIPLKDDGMKAWCIRWLRPSCTASLIKESYVCCCCSKFRPLAAYYI